MYDCAEVSMWICEQFAAKGDRTILPEAKREVVFYGE